MINDSKKSLNNFRTKILLKCYHCGERTEIYTIESMVCGVCGSGFKWHCNKCGLSFSPEEGELCLRCRWFKCPECKSCGCTIYNERNAKSRTPVKNAQFVHEFL